jgi:hypothetical protein
LAKSEYSVDAVVRNGSNETIIVDQIGVSPNVVGLAKGHSIHSTVEAVVRRGEEVDQSVRDCFFIIEPLGELALGLITFDAFNQLKDRDTVTIRLAWRNTRYVLPFRRNIKISTTAGDIRQLKEMRTDTAT